MKQTMSLIVTANELVCKWSRMHHEYQQLFEKTKMYSANMRFARGASITYRVVLRNQNFIKVRGEFHVKMKSAVFPVCLHLTTVQYCTECPRKYFPLLKLLSYDSK